MRRVVPSVLLAVTAAALLAWGGCGGASNASPKAAERLLPGREASTPSKRPWRPFSSASPWNRAVPSAAPLDPRSHAIVARLASEVTAERRETGGPPINTTLFSVPVYRVPAHQPTTAVRLRGQSGASALRAAWSAVPLPPDAQPAAGTDHHLVVWQPSSDKLWEFWHLSGGPGSWTAGWGGAIEHVSESSGVYGAKSWPGATRWWGASASSLSIAGGLITMEDLRLGNIDHALAMALPEVRSGLYSAPARRTDGTSRDPLALPEGAHLRLDPRLDLAAMKMPPITRAIAEAAQRYGLIVRDRAGTVCLYAEAPDTRTANPYSGPEGYFEGWEKPLAFFPWRHLQLLRMKLHPTQ
jgi:hypothetical protein